MIWSTSDYLGLKRELNKLKQSLRSTFVIVYAGFRCEVIRISMKAETFPISIDDITLSSTTSFICFCARFWKIGVNFDQVGWNWGWNTIEDERAKTGRRRKGEIRWSKRVNIKIFSTYLSTESIFDYFEGTDGKWAISGHTLYSMEPHQTKTQFIWVDV